MTADSKAEASTKSFGNVSTSRKISGAVVIVTGIVFLVIALMNNLFEIGPAFEE